uniref:Cytochrome c domain-containing protein n=1 Tax=Arion vulgaris TaxID=1028688 RepID=A0A0B7BHA0_9EUPU
MMSFAVILAVTFVTVTVTPHLSLGKEWNEYLNNQMSEEMRQAMVAWSDLDENAQYADKNGKANMGQGCDGCHSVDVITNENIETATQAVVDLGYVVVETVVSSNDENEFVVNKRKRRSADVSDEKSDSSDESNSSDENDSSDESDSRDKSDSSDENNNSHIKRKNSDNIIKGKITHVNSQRNINGDKRDIRIPSGYHHHNEMNNNEDTQYDNNNSNFFSRLFSLRRPTHH